jgi:hypothetical protein
VAVQDAPDDDHVSVHFVIDGEWKSFSKQSMTAQDFAVNPAEKFQRVDVREQRIKKVSADTLALLCVKGPAVGKILQR